MPSRSRLTVLLAVSQLACPGSGGGGGDGATLEVTPRAVVLTAGAGSAAFTATVSGDVDAVSWTLLGPGSIAPGQGLTTVYTPPARVDVDTDATITAHMNALRASAIVTVEPSPTFLVEGRVVRTVGAPVADATVVIPGVGAATTDATGAFAIAGVRAPYDLAVRAYRYHLLYVQQLRRHDPTLLIDVGGMEAPPLSASVSGQVSGGTGFFPQPAGYRTGVAIGAAAIDWRTAIQDEDLGTNGRVSSWADDAGAYGLVVPLTAASAEATLYALQWRADAAGRPVEFAAFARRGPLHLAAGASLDGQHLPLAMTPSSTATLSGRGSWPAGARLRIKARFGDARLAIVDDPAPPEAWSYATPAAADDVELTVTTGSPSGNILSQFSLGTVLGGVAPDATDAALAIVAPPNPDLPPDGATLTSADTVFRWQTMGAVSPVYVACFGGGNATDAWVLKLVTTASSVAVPDLSALGVTIPRGGAFTWWVYGTTAATTTDEACGPEGYLVRAQRFSWGRSIERTFHTPP